MEILGEILLYSYLAPLSECEVFDLAVQVVESQPEHCVIIIIIVFTIIISSG